MTEMGRGKRDSLGHDQMVDNEILERFVFICVHEIALRIRAAYGMSSRTLPQDWDGSPDDLEDRLLSLSYLPNYIITMADTNTEVNGMKSIEELRPVTALNQNYTFRNTCKEVPKSVSRAWSVVGGNRSMLPPMTQQDPSEPLLGHENKHSPVLPISWVGMTLSVAFYLHGVLRIWNFLKGDSLSWFAGTQQRHLNETQADLDLGLFSQQFWFWKLFSTAFTIECVYLKAHTDRHRNNAIKGGEAKFQALRQWFRVRIRLWSSITNVLHWEDARAALKNIVWPDNFPDDTLARRVWEEALSHELHLRE